MTAKVTWLFEYTTVPQGSGKNRTGGWSESWYSALSFNSEVLVNRAIQWAVQRCFLLPRTTKIIGMRFGGVATTNRAYVVDINQPGTQTSVTDVPSSALRYQAISANTDNTRLVVLRGIPDDWAKGGALFNDPAIGPAVQAFRNRIISDGWLFRGRSLTETQTPIDTIASNGAYVLASPAAFAQGDKVQIIRSQVTATGKRVGGLYTIASVADSTHGVLVNWQQGATTMGTIRPNVYVYCPTVATVAGLQQGVDIMQKKAGRSFFQYRGRRSTR